MPASSPFHILVTAGPTREKIDDVRDWGNIFTGQTGLDLALAFLDLGSVTLLTSNAAHAAAYDGYAGKAGMMGVERFASHADLQQLLAERMTSGDRVDVVAMTAAVADYRPQGVYKILKREPRTSNAETSQSPQEVWLVEDVSAGKVKSTHDQIAVVGVRTLKLIDQFRGPWAYKGILIKFKLEVGLTDEQLLTIAAASRRASAADLMVANTLAMARPSSGPGAAYLIDDHTTQRIDRPHLASAITTWTRQKLNPSNTP